MLRFEFGERAGPAWETATIYAMRLPLARSASRSREGLNFQLPWAQCPEIMTFWKNWMGMMTLKECFARTEIALSFISCSLANGERQSLGIRLNLAGKRQERTQAATLLQEPVNIFGEWEGSQAPFYLPQRFSQF